MRFGHPDHTLSSSIFFLFESSWILVQGFFGVKTKGLTSCKAVKYISILTPAKTFKIQSKYQKNLTKTPQDIIFHSMWFTYEYHAPASRNIRMWSKGELCRWKFFAIFCTFGINLMLMIISFLSLSLYTHSISTIKWSIFARNIDYMYHYILTLGERIMG